MSDHPSDKFNQPPHPEEWSLGLDLNLSAESGADLPDFWSRIQGQLNEDLDGPLIEVDDEFISAYYDNELSRDIQEVQGFEAQLSRNDEHNRRLGAVDVLSTALRSFCLRFEEACTVDVADQVMALYLAEYSVEASDETSKVNTPEHLAVEEDVEPLLVQLSAYYDNDGLSPSERLQAATLAESEPRGQVFLAGSARLSEAFTRITQASEAQAPENCWDIIAPKLEALVDTAKRANVVPLRRNQQRRWALAATAACVLLGFLFVFPWQLQPSESTRQVASVPAGGTSGSGLTDAGKAPAGVDAVTAESSDESGVDAELADASEQTVEVSPVANLKPAAPAVKSSTSVAKSRPKHDTFDAKSRDRSTQNAVIATATMPAGEFSTSSPASVETDERSRLEAIRNNTSLRAAVPDKPVIGNGRGKEVRLARYGSSAQPRPATASARVASAEVPSSEEFLIRMLQEEQLSDNEMNVIFEL